MLSRLPVRSLRFAVSKVDEARRRAGRGRERERDQKAKQKIRHACRAKLIIDKAINLWNARARARAALSGSLTLTSPVQERKQF